MPQPFLRPVRRAKSTLTAGFFAAATALAPVPAAHASSAEDAVRIVSQTADTAVRALEDATISDAEAEAIIAEVDIDRVAQFALGNKWSEISPEQQARYVDAFRTYAKNQLKQHLTGLTGASVEVTDTVPRGEGDVVVATRVTTSDSEMPQTISWRLIDKDGWSIVDIEAQDIWFAIEQRAQFEAILDANNGDIDALISEISS